MCCKVSKGRCEALRLLLSICAGCSSAPRIAEVAGSGDGGAEAGAADAGPDEPEDVDATETEQGDSGVDQGDSGCDGCDVGCGDLTNCNDVCVDTATSLDHCGACDKACLPPAGKGNAVCRAQKCIQTCETGEPPCGGKCCEPGPPNTQITCTNDQCGTRCRGVALSCSDGSETCGMWTFESGTTEGLDVDKTFALGWDQITFGSSTQRSSEGSRSLAMGVDNGGRSLGIIIPFCAAAGATTNVDGLLRIVASLRVEPAAGQPTFDRSFSIASFQFCADKGPCSYSEDVRLTNQDWSPLVGTFAGNVYKPQVNHVVLGIALGAPPGWKGVLFVDDIRIQ